MCVGCGGSDGSTPIVGPNSAPLFAKPNSPPPDPTVTWKLPLNDAGLAFRSDHQFSDGTNSVYANGVCDVTTWVEMSSSDPFPGFGHVSLGKGSRNCSRTFTLVFSDGQVETAGGNAVQRGLENPIIAWGATVSRTLAINLGGTPSSRCGRLLFGEGSQGAGVGSDSVFVTRSADGRTWHVYSNPDPSHQKALCENINQLFVMPVDFLIVADNLSALP